MSPTQSDVDLVEQLMETAVLYLRHPGEDKERSFETARSLTDAAGRIVELLGANLKEQS